MDKIIIDSLKIFAYHGVNPEETQMGQWFVLDIEAWADLTNACVTDELDDTVSYAAIIKTVKRTMTNRFNAFSNGHCGQTLTLLKGIVGNISHIIGYGISPLISKRATIQLQ